MKTRLIYLLKLLVAPLSIILLVSFFSLFEFSFYDTWSNGIKHLLGRVGSILVIVCFAWLGMGIIVYSKHLLMRKYALDSEDNLKARKVYTQISVIQRILNFIIIILSIALILLNFESIRKIGISLLASAGMAGLILGLAAQKLLATVLAGFQIAFTQPIRIDDVVIVENEWGWIEEITLTYVVVRIWDKRRLIVPTTYFMEKPFQNWTRNTSEILGTIFIYADYSVPIEPIRLELTRILESNKYWDGQTNVVQVTDANDKTIEIRALVSAKNSPAAWELRVDVREKLITFLQENYPQSLPKSRVSLDKLEV